jgi:hypothetical protein
MLHPGRKGWQINGMRCSGVVAPMLHRTVGGRLGGHGVRVIGALSWQRPVHVADAASWRKTPVGQRVGPQQGGCGVVRSVC